MTVADKWIPAVAFLERGFGLHPWPKYGENPAHRASRYLAQFALPAESNQFRRSLWHLRDEVDLLSDESALNPECLELQVQLARLARKNGVAGDICRKAWTSSLLQEIFVKTLREASDAGAEQIWIEFSSDIIEIHQQAGGESNRLAALPLDEKERLMGVIRRTEAVGYQLMKEILPGLEFAPQEISI